MLWYFYGLRTFLSGFDVIHLDLYVMSAVDAAQFHFSLIIDFIQDVLFIISMIRGSRRILIFPMLPGTIRHNGFAYRKLIYCHTDKFTLLILEIIKNDQKVIKIFYYIFKATLIDS